MSNAKTALTLGAPITGQPLLGKYTSEADGRSERLYRRLAG
jgi:hypothetical protein